MTDKKTKKYESTQVQAYISGLPYESSEEDLKNFLKTHSNIDSDEITTINMPTFQDSGRSKGYAIVTFKTHEIFLKSLSSHKQKLKNRFIDILPANPKAERKQISLDSLPDDCRLLFVKNLPYILTEESFKQSFEHFGQIESVRLARWNQTDKLKGFGFVEFKEKNSLRRIIKEWNKGKIIKVKEREVKIDYESNSRPKGSFRDEKGRLWSKTRKREPNLNYLAAKRRKSNKS
eukprot:snap_masked-scaffold_46-processed-gene-1.72-mRNA-1 protein AED:0.64 eAED:1.00 QI:0/-1/0/1/-1/1/1/0/232